MSGPTHDDTFRHGVHPAGHKEQTEDRPLERMPFVDRYVLPLGQHTGAPAQPVVRRGESVRRAQVIATAGGFVSTTLHAPVTGRVASIGAQRVPSGALADCIEIETDGYSDQRFDDRSIDWLSMSPDQFIDHVQQAGLVGLGGAAFPTHVKYRLPEGRRCRHLLVNGCECEPYLTCDHRVMVERADDVVRGIEIVMSVLDAAQCTIGVERNKPDAIAAMQDAIPADAPIIVSPLAVKYPQGAEKLLIKALFGIEVPSGKLPIDLEIVVNNVASMVAIADSIDRGQPLIERPVTVSGPGVDRPANLIVPIGTPVRDVLQHCGINRDTRQVIMGGPMMGTPLASLDVPVLKGTSGLLAFTEETISHPTEYACVRCGQCLEACGNFLNPARLARLARAGRWEELEESYVMDCMECGACTYTCPSGVPVVHLIRAAKATIRDRKAKEG